jgi:hypothetical protein
LHVYEYTTCSKTFIGIALVRRAYDAGRAAERERTEALERVVAAARPLRARFDETEATFEAAYYGLKRDWQIWGILRAALDREA